MSGKIFTMSLEEFIVKIEDLIKNGKPNQIIQHIKNVPGFLKSLKSLEKMIGMKDLKVNIVSQIKYYLLNKVRNVEGLDSHMFHTVLLGPPGSGKTTAAELLADIWMNLGVLKVEKVIPFGNNEIITETQIVRSEPYKELKREHELLKGIFAVSEKDYNDNIFRLNSIKSIMFEEKEKLTNLEKYIKRNSKNIQKEVYNDVNKKIESMNNTIDLLLSKYIPSPSIQIPSVSEEDYKEILDISMKNLAFDFVPKFIKLRRDDLIGKYLGHTAIKTREALMNGLGKVIFIDEAYELYNSNDAGTDSFGMECLSAILNFMNEFSDRTIIIFAGYEDLLKKTIFRVQPGLERRIAWTFTLNPYNESELVQIYEKQLKEKNWILEDKEKIVELFRKHKESFKHGGGDTQRLAMYTKTVFSDICFEKLIHNEVINSTIDYDIVMKALQILKETNENQKEKGLKIPEGMYS
jgi:SpoVK/Ycf46/Vps4 family AAA+-type ATPase